MTQRDSTGRFVPGHGVKSPGNPRNRAAQRFRALLVESVSEDDFKEAINKLVKAAGEGKPWAIKELLDRLLGKAQQSVELGASEDLGTALFSRFRSWMREAPDALQPSDSSPPPALDSPPPDPDESEEPREG